MITGDNAYRSDKQTISNANEYYPESNFVLYEQRNIPTIINKIKELRVKNSSEVRIINVFENVADSKSNELSAEFHVWSLVLLLTSWSQGELLFFIFESLGKLATRHRNSKKFELKVRVRVL